MLMFPPINITGTENSQPPKRALARDPHIPWRPETKFVDLLGDGTVIVDAEFSKTRVPGPKRRKIMYASLVYLEPLGEATEEGVLYRVHKDEAPRPSEDKTTPLRRLINITPDIEYRTDVWGAVAEIRLNDDQIFYLKLAMS